MGRFALLLALLGTALRAAEWSPALVVTNAALWTDAGIQPARELVVLRGRVAAVGDAGKLARPANSIVIDAQGDTLLPGLIDSHVHLVLGARTPKDFPTAEIHALTAKQLLRSGVTTGRIHLMALADGSALKKNAADDRHPSPRLQLGGPGFFGGQPTWENPRGNAWGVKSADDARAKVRRVHAAGADWIALHDVRKFQPGEAEAIVAEARKLGLGLMLGGDRVEEIARGLELGVDSIEYLEFTPLEKYPDDLLTKMQARGPALFVVPPIGYNHRYVAFRRGEMAVDAPQLWEFFPPAAAAFARDALREDRGKATPNAQRSDAAFPTLPEKFRQLRASGLSVVIGTDCGSEANFQSDALWWELETWRRLGVPRHEIIRAATTLPAKLLRDPSIGHLGAGARGDFVLYRGRIDDGAFTLERVRAVAKGGVLFVVDGKWITSADQPPLP